MGEEMYYKIKSILDEINIDAQSGTITTVRGGHGNIDNTGYLVFKKNNIKFQLHQVLAVIHFGKDCIGMTVNHINGIKTDNSVDNLELMTLSDNAKHEHRTGLANYCWQEKIKKGVRQLDMNGVVIAEYESIHSASKHTGFRIGNISNVCNGERKSASGFLWEFI